MPSGRSTPSWRCTTSRRWPTGALTQARFYLTAAAGLAVVALLLAGIGIYGVLAYAVTQRTRELGIRIALGADAAGLVRMVSMRGLGLALAGLTVGVAGALWTTRFLDSMLFGVTSRDPFTLAAVVVLFSVTARTEPRALVGYLGGFC